MATWRRRAIELFPDLRDDLQNPDFTIYSLFTELLPAVGEAHRAQDEQRLATIYGFAEWCARQRSKPPWNAAGVSFYEHLFDEPSMREAVIPWLPADIRAKHLSLWEWRLAPKDFDKLKKLLVRVAPRRE